MAELKCSPTDWKGGRPSMSTLPSELLVKILDLAITKPLPRKMGRVNYEPVLAVSKVCRQFYQMAISDLYTAIDVSVIAFPRCPSSLEQLHSTLKTNRTLGSHCQSLHISISDMPIENIRNTPVRLEDVLNMAVDIVSWLPNVQDFTARGSYSGIPVGWPFVKAAVENMGLLETMVLSSPCWKLSGTAPIIQAIEHATNLKDLEIEWYGGNQIFPIGEDKAQFTSLVARATDKGRQYGMSTAQALQLLRWSRNMEHFEYRGSLDPGRNPQWNTILNLGQHATRIKTLNLSPLEWSDVAFFDLTGFHSLEQLMLVVQGTEDRGIFRNILRYLPPRLRAIQLKAHFDIEGQGYRFLKAWIRILSAAATLQGRALERIDLINRRCPPGLEIFHQRLCSQETLPIQFGKVSLKCTVCGINNWEWWDLS